MIKLNPIAIGNRFIRQEIKIFPKEAVVETFDDMENKMHSQDVDRDLVTDKCKSVFDHDQEQIIIRTKNEDDQELA